MNGNSLARMAWRNLWRNRRRTLVTLSSIAFGIFLAVIMTGFGDAAYSKMIDQAARNGIGHVTLQHPEYQDKPSLTRTVPTAGALARRVTAGAAELGVARAVPRIGGQIMLATATQSSGATFLGIDPAAEDPQTLSVLSAVAEGGAFASADDRGIILGSRLAESLGVKLGRKVVYTLTDKRGEVVSGLARVSGILRTGAPSLDRGLCLLPIGALRALLGYGPDEATQVAIFLRDQRRSHEVAARLAGQVGGGVAALTWRETQPELAGFITVKVSSSVFLELVIGLLVAAGIFNTLFVSVMERMREFGIMMAIGLSPGRLFRLILWESLWLGLVGVFAAALVTAGPYYLMATRGLDMSGRYGKGTEIAGVAMDMILRVAIYPENALLIVVAAVAATMLAGLYPAWRAGRVVPVDSIKLV